MISFSLAWTLLTASMWTTGSSQQLIQESINIRYPEISSNENIDCDCSVTSCDAAYWFRTLPNQNKIEFLAKCNNAERVSYGNDAFKSKFSFTRSSSSFVLRIINVTEEDTGIYSCVLKSKDRSEIWKSGTLVKPGVTPPTLFPKIVPPPAVTSACDCSPQDGCGVMVFWPLVGLIGSLALALVCTLFYFSRLPKKCRHRFVKKRLMT
ncbi:T-cell surface glycoprotein CD8 beta chain [Pholidichthys leucotaenia]